MVGYFDTIRVSLNFNENIFHFTYKVAVNECAPVDPALRVMLSLLCGLMLFIVA